MELYLSISLISIPLSKKNNNKTAVNPSHPPSQPPRLDSCTPKIELALAVPDKSDRSKKQRPKPHLRPAVDLMIGLQSHERTKSCSSYAASLPLTCNFFSWDIPIWRAWYELGLRDCYYHVQWSPKWPCNLSSTDYSWDLEAKHWFLHLSLTWPDKSVKPPAWRP